MSERNYQSASLGISKALSDWGGKKKLLPSIKEAFTSVWENSFDNCFPF